MELGRGSFAEMEWPFIYYLSYIYFYILYIVFPAKTKKNKHIFFVLRPVTLPQPGLGRIAEQVQVLVA